MIETESSTFYDVLDKFVASSEKMYKLNKKKRKCKQVFLAESSEWFVIEANRKTMMFIKYQDTNTIQPKLVFNSVFL